MNEGSSARDRLTLGANCAQCQVVSACVCGHGGHSGSIVWTRGEPAALPPSGTTAGAANGSPHRTIMQSKQNSCDYFIRFISWGLSSFYTKQRVFALR